MTSERLFKILLWLIALHSFIVGLLLIFAPTSFLELFGFTITDRFFTTQGGVFHIVLVPAYILAAVNLEKGKLLIVFAISAKLIATVFLLVYYFFIDPILMVLVSGIGDFLMALALVVANRFYKNSIHASKK